MLTLIWFEGNLVAIVIPGLAFLVGLLVGLYFDDYREDRDWCRNVEEVLDDIDIAVDTIRTERVHRRQELQTASDRLNDLIAETPIYRHPVRRRLETLQEELDSLANTRQSGPIIGGYDHDHEPDSHGDVNRIDYIVEQAGDIDDMANEIDDQLVYGLFVLIPNFLYYNLLPARLRNN